MPNIGDPLTSDIPLVGSSGTAYATAVNEFLEEVKERLEASVPLSSIDIGELDMANNDILNAHGVGLYPQASATSDTGVIQNIGGDLYWVSTSGAVQITTGADINASGIGGITGDYGGVDPAQLRFVGADQTYYFYDDYSTGAWAYARARGFEIAGGATSTARVRIIWAGSSSYTITLPTAAPAARAMLQMDTSGNITATNTLATNQSITLAGTGTYKHGDHQITQNAAVAFRQYNGTVTQTGNIGTALGVQLSASGGQAVFYVTGLKKDDRIKSIRLAGTASVEPTTLAVYDQVDNAMAGLAVTKTGTITGGVATLTLDSPLTLGSTGENVFIFVVASSSTVTIYNLTVTYDRP